MMTAKKYRFLLCLLKSSLALLFLTSSSGFSQKGTGAVLSGRVIDGTTRRPLFDVAISTTNPELSTRSWSTGCYILYTGPGVKNVQFSLPGFQTKIITSVMISGIAANTLNIILFPLASKTVYPSGSRDSLSSSDSLVKNDFMKEIAKSIYNPDGYGNYLSGDFIGPEHIAAGTDKNGLLLVKRLNGVVIEDNPANTLNQSLLISGMGARYNQLTFNGSPLSSFDPVNQSYPLELLPAEAIDEVSVQKISDGSLPAGFAGGSVEIKTKDFTDKNFVYAQLNGGFSDGTVGKDFYGDNRNPLEPVALSGTERSLPSGFPTTRSQISYDQKNIQEQVSLAQQLKNNLAPKNYGKTPLNERILLGFGYNFKLKNGAKISLISYLNQMKSQQITEAAVQIYPDLIANPDPYKTGNSGLIRSQSSDTSYNYTSQLGLVMNASIVYGKSKISFRNYLGSQFSNAFISRYGVDKPDEDSIAHRGISYLTTQRYFYMAQLSGHHVLGASGKLDLNWQASYTHYNEQNPDQRQFLLRQDSANHNLYEIATPGTTGVITNTGRLWRNLTDNNFTGAFNISSPFNMFSHAQVLSGGIYLQENYREFYSDLLLTQGTGFTTQEQLTDPQRYYPGGLSVSNFYVNTIVNTTLLQQANRGNYTASANLGAAYIHLESRLSNKLLFNLGFRMESNSQLSTNIQYRYFSGYKNPQIFPINENTRITTFNPLPSVSLIYTPVSKLKIWGSYFASVNRPGLQELVQYAYYNQQSFMLTTGNPLLATTYIDNLNLGINWIASAFSNFSIGGFYKKINQPIENIVTAYNYGSVISTPNNTGPATVSGLEAAIKLRLRFIKSPWLSHLTVFADGNITQSKVEAGPIRSISTPDVSEHTLSGTPDYTFRAGLIIQQPSFPEISIIYRNTGGYITALGSGDLIRLPNGNTIRTMPDYRMDSRHQMDIQISQQFYKGRIQLIAGANNLAAGSYTEFQDLNGNKKFDSPLILQRTGNQGGYYAGGVDNTVISIKQLPTYYFAISYLFK